MKSEINIADALERASAALKEHGCDTPLLDAKVILGSIINKDALYMHVHGDELLSEEQTDDFNKKISDRLNDRPVAYIVGEKEFYSRSFKVKEGVLIPRSDTEIAVEEALKEAKNFKEGVRILDLCCGSGAIGLTLAKEIEKSYVLLTDISPTAVETANENKRSLEAENAFVMKSDLFEDIADAVVDIVVSNPPYVTQEEMYALSCDISKWEPHEALFGGSDGLSFYREIVPEAKNHLSENGVLILEVGSYQANDVKELMEKHGYKNIKITKDYSGLDRVVSGKLCKEEK